MKSEKNNTCSHISRTMPSGWWYVVAGTMFIVALVGNLIFAFFVVVTVFSSIHRLKMPGEYAVTFDKPGVYRTFHEYVSRIDEEKFSTNKDACKQLSIGVISERTKQRIPLLPDSEETYNDNDRYIGFSIYQFEIPESGTYNVRAEFEDGKESSNIIISIKPSLSSMIRRPMLLSSLYTIVMCLLGVTIFWVTFMRRRKARQFLDTKDILL